MMHIMKITLDYLIECEIFSINKKFNEISIKWNNEDFTGNPVYHESLFNQFLDFKSIQFDKDISFLLDNKPNNKNEEKKMTRITYKTVENMLTNKKPLTLVDTTYLVTINTLDWNFTISNNQLTVYSGIGSSLVDAKRQVKLALVELGFVFESETRTTKSKLLAQEVAA